MTSQEPQRMHRTRATWRNHVLAEYDRIQIIDGYTYFPRPAVHMGLLRVSPKTDRDRECPNGVQFYDLVHGNEKSPRAAWSYEAPQEALKKVDHWIAFWEDVEVR